MKNNILITVPNLYLPGGVAVLYSNLDFHNQKIAQYFPIYFDDLNSSHYGKIKRLIKKYFIFFNSIEKIDTVLINPSLTINSFFRDSIFAFITKMRKKKLVVFWHGWEEETEKRIRFSKFMKYIFKNTFGKADGTVILGSIFKNKLLGLGFNEKSKFLIFQNVASNEFIDYGKEFFPKEIKREVHILFMSRIEENKGAMEAVKIFQLVQKHLVGYEVYLTVAGDGSDLPKIKKYVKENRVKNVDFPGHVEGVNKHTLFNRSHLFLFPSSYGEGMPLVILEGMAYGLPILSSPKGGIPDIVKEGINGFLVEPDIKDRYLEMIISLVTDVDLFSFISKNNFTYSKNNLTPEIGRKRLIDFCNKIYEKN